MEKFNTILKTTKPVIGMIHVNALPGSPGHTLETSQIIDQALKEAEVYKKTSIDAVMIENMHDRPYLKGAVGHEVAAAKLSLTGSAGMGLWWNRSRHPLSTRGADRCGLPRRRNLRQ